MVLSSLLYSFLDFLPTISFSYFILITFLKYLRENAVYCILVIAISKNFTILYFLCLVFASTFWEMRICSSELWSELPGQFLESYKSGRHIPFPGEEDSELGFLPDVFARALQAPSPPIPS